MSKVKMRLTRPTVGKKPGDVIEVDADQVDALVAAGSASRVTASAKKAAAPRPRKPRSRAKAPAKPADQEQQPNEG